MRRAAKVDENQGAIVDALRKCGAMVLTTHGVGGGFPDLICAKRNIVYLIECKAIKGKLTPDQKKLHAEWPITILRSPDEAIEWMKL